jgi:hypothetical protein
MQRTRKWTLLSFLACALLFVSTGSRRDQAHEDDTSVVELSHAAPRPCSILRSAY